MQNHTRQTGPYYHGSGGAGLGRCQFDGSEEGHCGCNGWIDQSRGDRYFVLTDYEFEDGLMDIP